MREILPISIYTCCSGVADASPAREFAPLLSWTGLTCEGRGPGAAPKTGLGRTLGSCPGGCAPTSGDDDEDSDCLGNVEDVEAAAAAAAGGSVL